MTDQSLRDENAIIEAMETHLPDEQARLLDPVTVAEFVELVECVEGALPDDGTLHHELDRNEGVATVTFRAVGVETPVAVVVFGITYVDVVVRSPSGTLERVPLERDHPADPIDDMAGTKRRLRDRIGATVFGRSVG